MSKAKRSITLEIKGRPWTFTLMPDKAFDKLHNVDGGSRTGMTWASQYRVDFRASDWTLTDIIHELGHVVYAMAPTRSADLSVADVEETMCDIYSTDYFDIRLWSSRIAECFFGRE